MPAEIQQLHRRKSSKDDSDLKVDSSAPELTIPPAHSLPNVTIEPLPPRIRAQSSPHHPGHNRGSSSAGLHPPSPGPYRSSFVPRPLNGHQPPSPFRSSFAVPLLPQMNGHSRTRSISTPFSPTSPSPLSASFPAGPHNLSPPIISPRPPSISTSYSAPDDASGSASGPATQHSRRHSRMHSRNLSVFFPRPGSLPHSAISEDGAQEVEFPVDEEAPLIPAAGSSVSFPGSRERQPITPLGQGFTFGGRHPSMGPTPELMTAPRSATTSMSSASRRGHHHKHSMSHNFFSFLDPGSALPQTADSELHTQPTPTPVSPWSPMSAPADSLANGVKVSNGHAHTHTEVAPVKRTAVVITMGQFLLGAWLWVTGQQVGSLSCTGLGYWVVFDAFGVALSAVVPGWLASNSDAGTAETERRRIRRPYGNARVKTVLLFAQAVYLMFSSVYVCKETIEHLLLSGGGDGHHHHHGDEEEGFGIDFPIFMIFITFISLIGTAHFYKNNKTIVDVTGNRIPSIGSLIRSIWSTSRHTHEPTPTSGVALILTNPFIASPLFFCSSLLFVALFLPPGQHRLADLVLASIIAVLTFKVAYSACVVVGTVLLQTSPPRGLASGKMEAFMRAMREIERHPQVLHLPAPHIWQLTPSSASSTTYTSSSKSSNATVPESLVVTLELHVKQDLGDDDVLKLTKWAWERCVSALGSLKDYKENGEVGGPEVTVGVVRG